MSGSVASGTPCIIHIYNVLYHKLETQSSAPEDGRNHRPKHDELIGIINKPLLLHLVCCLYHCNNDVRSSKYQSHKMHVLIFSEISVRNISQL